MVCMSLLLLFVTVSFAAAETMPFVLSGEMRVRNENDNRDFDSSTGYKSFNLLRTRIGIGVQPADDMKVFVQMLDARVAGRDNNPSSVPGMQEESTLDLHQGYFQVDNIGWQGFGLKAGRMEMRYGNERLLGVTDWANVPTAFDGGVLALDRQRFSVQGMYANLVERDTPTIGTADTRNSDATLQAGFGTVVMTPNANFDLQVINVRDKGDPALDDTRKLLTLGGRVHGTAVQRVEYSVEGAYQNGSQATGATTSIDVAAYMFAGEVGMTFGGESRPVRVAAGYDYLSGDADGTADGKLETFNTLYGDEHTHYGLMDVTPVLSMAATSTTGLTSGLQDMQLHATGTVWQSVSSVVSVGGEYHYFQLAQAGSGSSALGNEVDVHATWAYREHFVPTLGLSAFVPGDAVGPDADTSYWAYLQGTVAF
jgi:hypothetical protein